MPDEAEVKLPEATLTEFFESKPINEVFRITGVIFHSLAMRSTGGLSMPPTPSVAHIGPISLWCNTDQCDGIRNFDPIMDNDELRVYRDDEKNFHDQFIVFVCRNCRESLKKYAISYRYGLSEQVLFAVKLGEDPPLSFHIQSRLRKLVGSELEKFNKGLRSEAHGLGVGAFAYYRQVVENQKDRLIDEIIKVARLANTSDQLIAELEEAKSETQYWKAVKSIKEGIPEVLQIDGHNPLTLLHEALSEGIHAGTDAECLEVAQDIRVVLSELTERLHTALKDDQELKKAVTRIQNRSQRRSDK